MARILIIDDEVEFRWVTAHVLDAAGHQIRQAANGKAGHTLFRTIEPDLILLDIWMPEQDGIQTLSEVLAERAGTRIIVMSGQPTRAGMPVFEVASILGAAHTLIKPFSRGELLDAVIAVLHR